MTAADSPDVIHEISDLSSHWLSQVLQHDVASFESEKIGTGQVSECYRVYVKYADVGQAADAPQTVVLKIASTDPTSRGSGRSLGIYEREVLFYKTVAPTIDASAGRDSPLAPCYYAEFKNDFFSIVLGDASPADVGDDVRGTTFDQAKFAVTALARLHAPTMREGFLESAQWLQRPSQINQAVLQHLFAGYAERYRENFEPAHFGVMGRFVSCFNAYLVRQTDPGRVLGLVHGDYRLDNMLFGKEGADKPITVVDWQTVSFGSPLSDLAYFLGCSVPVPMRHAHADSLIAQYHEALGPDSPLTLEQCKEGVREQSFFGIIMGIVSPMLVERTERGDEMFMTMMQRHCTQVLDLDALDTLPEPSKQETLKPKEEDEHVHTKSDDPLWNESWYFDVVDEEQNAGAYVRLGLTPNQKGSWYTAMITLPEGGCVAVTDYEAPHPRNDLVVSAQDIHATHDAIFPLKEYLVTLKGRGTVYPDPGAILRGEPGSDTVDVTLDLTWHTDGEPYMWRLTPRYEIPCRVSGTVTAGATTLTFHRAKAQRDHSWAARDWWGADWMWCAFHIGDGTRVHGADLRIPGRPAMSVGYIQGPDRDLSELVVCTSEETMGDDGLPASASVTIKSSAEDEFVVLLTPKGHAPLRLVAEDGRVANFTRAWVQLELSDGRKGVGWVEWNHNKGKE